MYASGEQYISPQTENRRPLVVWLVVSIGASFVALTIVAAPLLLATGHPLIAFTIYRAFSHLCHQIPERSFYIFGHQFAVCARCTGLYAGFTVALFIYPLVRSIAVVVNPARKWLFLAAVPMAIDFCLDFFGFWKNTHTSRLLTGLLLGGVAVFYVMPGVVELSLRRWRARTASLNRSTDVSAEMIASAPSDYSTPQRRI